MSDTIQEAIEYHKKNLAIAQEVGDRAGERRAYCNFGNAYQSIGQFQKAIKCHEKELAISKEVGDRRGEGISYGNLGNACHCLGQFQEAIEYHKKDLAIAKEIGDRAGEGMCYGCHDIYLTSLVITWSFNKHGMVSEVVDSNTV